MKETVAAGLNAPFCFSHQGTGEMKGSVTEIKTCNYEGIGQHLREILQLLKRTHVSD